MSKILVTGGTGFIGSHLAERLLIDGNDVVVLALPKPFEPIETENLEIIKNAGAQIVLGDLRDKDSLKNLPKDVDYVYHLAAISRPMNIPTRQYYAVNVEGTKNILEVYRNSDIKRFIHTSTVSVLGTSPDGHPLKEDEFQKERMHYALSKKEAEGIALDYYGRFKVPLVVIRPSLVYGPRCLVRLIMFKFVKKGLFPLFNKGKAKMEFAYVANVVDALILAKEKNVVGEIFNVTDGKSYEVRTVMNAIAKAQGVSPPSINLPTFVGKLAGFGMEGISKVIGIYPPFSSTAADWMSKDVNVYDCTKAKKVLGYKPEIGLEEGVRGTVDWFKSRGDL